MSKLASWWRSRKLPSLGYHFNEKMHLWVQFERKIILTEGFVKNVYTGTLTFTLNYLAFGGWRYYNDKTSSIDIVEMQIAKLTGVSNG